MDVRLQDIERAVRFFQRPASERSQQQQKSLQWLWKRLSWSARMLGCVGMKERTWWYRRYVLPILCQAADAHLRRFLLGDWREVEERRLLTLFSFFSKEVLRKPKLFSQEITRFLRGEAPSFAKERKTIQSLLSEKKKGFGSFSWYKDETFSQYQRRMHALQKRSERLVSQQSNKNEPQQVQDPLTSATKARLKEALREIQDMKEKVQPFCDGVSSSFSKVFPLRAEVDEIVTSVQEIKEGAFDLVMTLDELAFWICEISTDKETSHRLGEVQDVLKRVSLSLDELRSREKQLKKDGEHKRSSLQRKVQALSRTIDRVHVLPSGTLFREQQSFMIKMARGHLKAFKSALSKGPGPHVRFEEMEKEVSRLLEVARGLYNEGIEIDKVKKELVEIRKKATDALQSKNKKNLKELLLHIETVLESLDVIGNREQACAQIRQEAKSLQLDLV